MSTAEVNEIHRLGIDQTTTSTQSNGRGRRPIDSTALSADVAREIWSVDGNRQNREQGWSNKWSVEEQDRTSQTLARKQLHNSKNNGRPQSSVNLFAGGDKTGEGYIQR
eukprot:Gregarina_sp_Pseudo_9__3105@NODE_32_length_5543_cov_23_716206_g30_i0_p6_GENE_NODE_32_length_5543_cov_23_716206_g30_i0NODE_32_length_5543_cov_23_716206_g30_i0_p6_ORF_typecomplete_len109_score5_07BDV_P10/PF06515_11/1_NODE_32_length_5543_cov_23_716206_g30_i09221248